MNDKPSAKNPPPHVDASEAQPNAANPAEDVTASGDARTVDAIEAGGCTPSAPGQDQPPDEQERQLSHSTSSLGRIDASSEAPEDPPDDYRVGYKRTPKETRFKPGQSGNPSGKPKHVEATPGNKLEAQRRDLLDELIRLLDLDVPDLELRKDDSILRGFAKSIVRDAFRNDGAPRKFFMQELLGKALLADRTRPSDPSAADAEMLQSLMRAVIDPTISDKEADQAMDRAVARRETEEEYIARRNKKKRCGRSRRKR